MRDRTTALDGPASRVGERAWCALYVAVRRKWLANHANPVVRRTVYRMDAMTDLIEAGNWDLKFPFTVRGVRIDEESLGLSNA